MIAHIDADAFFASAIVRKNPHLQGKPLLALGMGGGCVIAASYEAKAFGVKTGMRLVDALKLCPQALKMPADFHEAARASHEIESILGEQCPMIEQMSVDEWYLDLRNLVGGLPRDLTAWALKTQKNVLDRTALSVSIGVGPSKLLAKMAGEYRKPAGVTVVTLPLSLAERSEAWGRGLGGGGMTVEALLRDRPAAAIPGIGRRRMIVTDAHGWATAWDIAQAPAEELRKHFGKSGVELKEELLGNELSSVSSESALPKSVSRCRSFRPTTDRDLLWAQLLKHVEYTILKMRRDGLSCFGISVWLRGDAKSDFAFHGANASLPQPSHTTDAILSFVKSCFAKSFQPRMAYTQAGLALWRLVPQGTTQYSLFCPAEEVERDESIQRSLDILHDRFGRNSITRGAALRVKSGTTVTMEMPVYE